MTKKQVKTDVKPKIEFEAIYKNQADVIRELERDNIVAGQLITEAVVLLKSGMFHYPAVIEFIDKVHKCGF